MVDSTHTIRVDVVSAEEMIFSGEARFVALFTDITPMMEHHKQLEHIAHYDALTDLPNRVLLADRLRQAMNQGFRQVGGCMLRCAARGEALLRVVARSAPRKAPRSVRCT